MNTSYKKTAAACGLFASGILAGYAASSISRKAKKPVSDFTRLFRKIELPRIVPQIPEFHQASASLEMVDDLRLHG